MTGVIVFEGDFIKEEGYAPSRVIRINDWDEDGDATLYLENGRCIGTKAVTDSMILCESEVV
jgi:hypothetical protein